MGLTEINAAIRQIDRDVDAIRKQLRRLEKIDRLSAASWQDAWDKHPDLHAQECALFRQRGEFQRQRNAIEEQQYVAKLRSERSKRAAKTRRLGKAA